MKRATKLTLLVLALVTVGIMAALLREASENPVFRAADHATLEECLRSIPAEWLDGSIERTGAETACRHLHAPSAVPPR
jgi:hypothetical protein